MGTNSVLSTAVLLLLNCFAVDMSMAAILNIDTDQSSLLAFKHRITLDPKNILAKNWSSSVPVCSWIGVTCSSSHLRVIALNLSNRGLVGTISPYIGNLSFLSKLDLKSNWFQGSLPNEMTQLRRMKTLSIGFNNFSGEIPSWFVFLPKLKMLNLLYNSFTGTIPLSLFNVTSLERLDIRSNKLTGFLPPNLFMAPALRYVDISYNQISGSIPWGVFNNSLLVGLELGFNNLSGQLPENICNQLPKLKWLCLFKNQFTGKLPLGLFNCRQLQHLFLSVNNFTGGIPHEIGNLTMIKEIYLGYNNFLPGKIPHEIGNLHRLEFLSLPFAGLDGTIPSIIFNISTIKYIILIGNRLSGSFPSNFGFALPNLEGLVLESNYLSGKIPKSLSNATMLTRLALGNNAFFGIIPDTLGNLRKLQFLSLFSNHLTNEPSTPELSIINSLANCRFLRRVDLSFNPFNSLLPISIGNLSNSLEYLIIQNCNMGGSIPIDIGNLSGLISINLAENKLFGTIPSRIGDLKKLQALSLYENKLGGFIPHEICQLKSMGILNLSRNGFIGSIPTCLGNLKSLRQLRLNSNTFNSTIPSTLWSLSDLLILDLSSNKLEGPLPLEIGNLKVMGLLYLSQNHLSGKIPSTIGELQHLINLSLAKNDFEGHIPKSFGNMVNLEFLDLSNNNFSGVIPMSLKALVYLCSFNVSFNKLEGEIPNSGSFTNFSSESFMGNVALCGGVPSLKFPKCKTIAARNFSKATANVLKYVLPTLATITLIFILTYVLMKCQRKGKTSISLVETTMATWRRISYYELQRATNGFSDANLLGIGSFGKVYRGIFSNGMNIAIKVFDLNLERGFKSFEDECEILSNVRHRNLIKIISVCANIDFKALVLSYMPNGSLEKWLHSHNYCLSIIQRLNIMIDVATALDYLHHRCPTSIIHCDLKPSNVLLDEDMVGHVTDFGVAKLLSGGSSIAQTITLATMGYMAPEYGLEGLVSKQGDIYSFGILLMETFTQKKPIDGMFQGEFNIKNWVKESYPSAIIQIVDAKLVKNKELTPRERECISSIMGLALDCSTESPNERKDIKEVLDTFQKIKKKFLNKARVTRPI